MVKRDDGDVFWNAQSHFTDRSVGTDCKAVVHAQECFHFFVRFQQVSYCAIAICRLPVFTEDLTSKFDVILNLFTSFGFFEDDSEDIAILQNIKNGLKLHGVAVIDFMNCKKVISNLIPEEILVIEGITFKINKYVENGFIVKEINFEADGEKHTYFEKVKNLDFQKINSYLKLHFSLTITLTNVKFGSKIL